MFGKYKPLVNQSEAIQIIQFTVPEAESENNNNNNQSKTFEDYFVEYQKQYDRMLELAKIKKNDITKEQMDEGQKIFSELLANYHPAAEYFLLKYKLERVISKNKLIKFGSFNKNATNIETLKQHIIAQDFPCAIDFMKLGLFNLIKSYRTKTHYILGSTNELRIKYIENADWSFMIACLLEANAKSELTKSILIQIEKNKQHAKSLLSPFYIGRSPDTFLNLFKPGPASNVWQINKSVMTPTEIKSYLRTDILETSFIDFIVKYTTSEIKTLMITQLNNFLDFKIDDQHECEMQINELQEKYDHMKKELQKTEMQLNAKKKAYATKYPEDAKQFNFRK